MKPQSPFSLIFALSLLSAQACDAQEVTSLDSLGVAAQAQVAPCDCTLPLGELLAEPGCELRLSLTQSQLFLPFETRVTFELDEPHAIPVRMWVGLQARDAELMKRVVRVATRSMVIQPESVASANGVNLLVADSAFTGIEVAGKGLGSLRLEQLNVALGFFAVECSPRDSSVN